MEILPQFDMQNKPVWEHKDLLLDTGEPMGNKKDAECMVPQGPYVIVYFDGACRQKKGAVELMI